MKRKTFWVLPILLFLLCPLFSQIRLSGSLQSSLYSFETAENEQRGDFYQGLQLRLLPENYRNLYLNTYLRVAKKGDADWEEKVYNLYIHWNSPRKQVQIRLGRQFLYRGVINGTLDGLQLSLRPVQNMNIKFFAGIEAPYQRDLRVVGSDSNAFGAYVSYRFPDKVKVDLSYFQRQRDGNTIWQLLGIGLNGKFKNDVYYQIQIDHNLKATQLQGVRSRLTYYYKRWSFTGEFNHQKPRILEDSYFWIFELEAYNQLRGGITYQIKSYQVGFQYLFTAYSEDQTNQGIVTIGNRWGLVGLVLQNGFGGDNVGIYGDIRYEVLPGLTVKFFSSYYNYQRHTIEIGEEATALSGGLIYRPFRFLALHAELQESRNSFYENDVRGLFRVNYFFNK